MNRQEQHEYTCGEFEEMDLRELHNEVFMVAVGSGSRDSNQFLCSTLCGPMEFYDMVGTVGNIWKEQQIHAKVLICSKEFGTAPTILDENTIDFIEARYDDIIMDGMMGGELFNQVEYTCKAGFVAPEENNEQEETSQDGDQ